LRSVVSLPFRGKICHYSMCLPSGRLCWACITGAADIQYNGRLADMDVRARFGGWTWRGLLGVLRSGSLRHDGVRRRFCNFERATIACLLFNLLSRRWTSLFLCPRAFSAGTELNRVSWTLEVLAYTNMPSSLVSMSYGGGGCNVAARPALPCTPAFTHSPLLGLRNGARWALSRGVGDVDSVGLLERATAVLWRRAACGRMRGLQRTASGVALARLSLPRCYSACLLIRASAASPATPFSRRLSRRQRDLLYPDARSYLAAGRVKIMLRGRIKGVTLYVSGDPGLYSRQRDVCGLRLRNSISRHNGAG